MDFDSVVTLLFAASLVFHALMILDLKRKQVDNRIRQVGLEHMLYGQQPSGYPKITHFDDGERIIMRLIVMKDSPIAKINSAQLDIEQALDSIKALRQRVETLEDSRPTNIINPDELR